MAAAAFASSPRASRPRVGSGPVPFKLDETFKQTLIRTVDGFDEDAIGSATRTAQLDEHMQEVHQVESAPVVKSGAVQKLFSKPWRRAEILSWHLRRQCAAGRGRSSMRR